MRTKRILSVVLAGVIAAGSVSAVERGAVSTVAAAETITEGYLTYTVLSDGTLEVSCPDDKKDTLTKADIPAEVKGRRVTSIGERAFAYCTNLTEVTIPNSVTSIGGHAFFLCQSLTKVKIPDSVTSIGLQAFSYCNKLTEMTIPYSVTSIRAGFMSGCTGLTAIDVDKKNAYYTSENGVLFNKDKTALVQYPAGKTDKSYTIPDGVTKIGLDVFFSCANLTELTIPASVTSIEMAAFSDCAIKDVYYSGTKEQWKKIDIGSDNEELTNATIHYNNTGSGNTSTDTPAITDMRATTTVGGKTITLTVDKDGNVDASGLANGTYTFTFSASNCAPRTYDVTVSGGKVTKGLENGVKLHRFGDINGDGVVNTQDVAKANAHVKGTSLLKGYELTCINVNSDNNINVQDVALMNAHAKNTKMLW